MQLLDDFIDGELPEIEHRKVEQHISECVQCDGEAGFLRSLSLDAASLPKSIMPDKDLWPEIEAKIIAARVSKDDLLERVSPGPEQKYSYKKAAAWRWWIAAAAVFGALVLAGTYLGIKKQMTGHPNLGAPSNAAGKQSPGPAQPSINGSLDNQRSVSAEQKTVSPDIRASSTQPSTIPTYALDGLGLIFVSNYGLYGLSHNLDPSSFDSSAGPIIDCIIRFDQNENQSWTPPLPPGSRLLSLYPGGGSRLWIAYAIQQPEFQICFAELDFRAESQIRSIWKSGDLNIIRFVPGPQGLIYATGFRNSVNREIAKLTKGQSITAELVHIIDTTTGEERHLFPMTLRPGFDTQYWVGQTMMDFISVTPTIAVKSNGNFFITIDRSSQSVAFMRQIRNEAVEYSPDGNVAKTWKLGTLGPNAYLNRIFVDLDDSILAEIVRYSETGTADSTYEKMVDRYLLRVSLSGKVTRYEPSFPLDEDIQGWMGQAQSLVTRDRGNPRKIRIHRLSF
jgi:hypothetical protein